MVRVVIGGNEDALDGTGWQFYRLRFEGNWWRTAALGHHQDRAAFAQQIQALSQGV